MTTTDAAASRTREAYYEGLVENFPRLTFHYGLSFEDIVKMPKWAVDLYNEKLPELLAGEQMKAIEAISFPHYKENAQTKIIRRLESVRPQGKEEPVAASDEEYLASLGGMGFGLVVSPPASEEVKGE